MAIAYLYYGNEHITWRQINDAKRKSPLLEPYIQKCPQHISPPVTIPVVTKWLQDDDYKGHYWLHQAELQSYLFTEPQKTNCVSLPYQAACAVHAVWSGTYSQKYRNISNEPETENHYCIGKQDSYFMWTHVAKKQWLSLWWTNQICFMVTQP